MRHVKAISKRPALTTDVPMDLLIEFVIGILMAVQTLFQAKEQAESVT